MIAGSTLRRIRTTLVAIAGVLALIVIGVRATQPAPRVAPNSRHHLPVFRYAVLEPTQSIDPRRVTGLSRSLPVYLFEGLVGMGTGKTLEFVGARSVDISRDGLTYMFALRPEVKWSDGTPVTALDYEYAYKSALDPAFGSETVSILYFIKNAEAYNSGAIKSADSVQVKAVNPYTLRITLERPKSLFLEIVATAYSYMPVPRHVAEQFGRSWVEPGHIVTNGPYTIGDWTRRSSATLVRNPYYWGKPPYFAEVHIIFPGDPSVQGLTMFEAGDLDFAAVPSSDVARVQANARLSPLLHSVMIPRLYGLMLDQRRPPFSDVRVRRALYLSIDRFALQKISRGQLTPAFSPIPQSVLAHSDDIRLAGDTAEARALMREAGYPGGRGFPRQTMVVRNTAIEVLQAEAIQAMASSALGIDLRIDAVEAAAYRSFGEGTRDGNVFNIVLFSATADNPDPWLYHNFMIGKDGRGYFPGYWHNAAYNALLDRSLTETNPDSLLALYRRLDRLVVDDVGFIPLTNENLLYVLIPQVANAFIPFGEFSPNVSRATVLDGVRADDTTLPVNRRMR